MTKLNYRFSWIASCLLITSLLASNAATADDVLLPDVVHSKHECQAQGKDFGDIPLTQCLKGAADNSSVCASAVMFSKVFPFWRCRCCAVDTADKLPGNAHNLWDIYTLSTRPIEKLQAALETATKACKGASTPENALAAAKVINDVARHLDYRGEYKDTREPFDTRLAVRKSGAPETAAAILRAGCDVVPKGACGTHFGAALKHNLRMFVLLAAEGGVDSITADAALQAYPGAGDSLRRRLLTEQRVLLGDADAFTDRSVNFIHSLFESLPPHLKEGAVFKDARFFVLTRDGQFNCGGDDRVTKPGRRGADMSATLLGAT